MGPSACCDHATSSWLAIRSSAKLVSAFGSSRPAGVILKEWGCGYYPFFVPCSRHDACGLGVSWRCWIQHTASDKKKGCAGLVFPWPLILSLPTAWLRPHSGHRRPLLGGAGVIIHLSER